jgi:hypothetical protein
MYLPLCGQVHAVDAAGKKRNKGERKRKPEKRYADSSKTPRDSGQ